MSKIEAIEVPTRAGTQIVRATFLGSFAVHRALVGIGLTLTHAATGRLVATGFQHEACALRLAEELDKSADWGFTDLDAPRAWSKSRKAKLRGLCQTFLRDDVLRDWSEARPTPEGAE